MGTSNINRSLKNFRDILSDHHGKSDFMYMSKKWNPTIAYHHYHKINPRKIKQDVFNSVKVQEAIQEAAIESQEPISEVCAKVHDILNEIGYSKQMPVIRWLGILLLKILKQCCEGLFVNEESIYKVKSMMGQNPVIFAPSHRSYADFILMSFICFHYEIDIPVIAAGMDFHSMWFMGEVLRQSCAFFMRRSFGSDKLYWTVFGEYVRHLVTDGDTAIEFFVEGTRSRTAKSLMPKFGFLSMTLEPFFTGHVPDVTIVPINISYDRTLEESLFAYELLGVPKPKESTSGFLKALKMLDQRYGRIYIEFGDPFSVHELNKNDTRWKHCIFDGPICKGLNPEESMLCMEVAHRMVYLQQKHCVLTPFNVIAVILTHRYLSGDGEMKVPTLIREVSWLTSVLESLGALVDCPGNRGLETSVTEAINVHRILVAKTRTETLRILKFHSPPKTLGTEKLKGHELSQETMEFATSLILLQHYVNPCMHYIIGPAIATVVMQKCLPNEEVQRSALFAKYQYLRKLLSHEFVFHPSFEVQEFKESLKQLDLLNIVEVAPSGCYVLGNHRKLQQLFCNLLLPFMEGYSVFCETALQFAFEPCSERMLVQETQRRVEELLKIGKMSHPYSLSLDMHSSTLQSLVAHKAVVKLKRNGSVLYLADNEKLNSIIKELSNFSELKGNTRSENATSELFAMQPERAKL